MSNELWRTLLAIVTGAHGIGHIVFLVPLLGVADWGESTRSWLLSAAGGDVLARIVGSVLFLAATAGFIAVAVGMFGQQAWWRGLAIGSAVVSLAGLVLFWANPVPSSAFFALAFNVAVLVALVLLNWPSPSLAGS
jgi:hypothetical protein